MVEYVASRNYDARSSCLDPSTLKSFVSDIQQSLSSQWKYNMHLLSGPIFTSVNLGLLLVLDNKIEELQRQGKIRKSHGVLLNH